MRADLLSDNVELPPGQVVKIGLEVTNTLEVIDGVTAEVEVASGITASTEPALLPLFPDSSGRIMLELTASPTFPSGSYQLPVQVRSSARPGEGTVAYLSVVVPPNPAGELTVLPPVQSSRRRARYTVVCENTGNTTLDLALSASDSERASVVRFASPTISIEPDGSATSEMAIKCRRRWLGSELSRELTVVGTAHELELDTKAVFRHRPVIPRGLRTVAVLAVIVALWAAVFVVALERSLSKDPLTKQVPASFYAALQGKSAQARAAALGGGPFALASSNGAIPAGAVPKSGVVVGVGGTVSGTVDAKSTQAGVGRITVEAMRSSPHGELLVASSATASDGTYSIVGLLPGPYQLLFEAQGYRSVWFPDATSLAGAKPVNVDALQTTPNIDVVIAGFPGSITGTVQTGQTPQVPVTVTVEPQQGSTAPIAQVTTNSQGTYTIPDLPAPGTYDLSFAAKGYAVAGDVEELTGGESRIANTVTMTAGDGTISGTVTSGSQPLGGVMITAKANGLTYTSATPTEGNIGLFTLADLPSPATYLITFSKAGFGSKTIGETLGPGQDLVNVAISMNGGAGTISGEVVSPSAKPLGGVTVSVGNGTTTTTTQTLTAGTVGTFDVSGLQTPGTYTLTFSLAGYESVTREVQLGSSGSASNIDVTLPSSAGEITGTVVSEASDKALSGVTVSLTNGSTVMTTTSASQPAGGFTFAGLAPGSYTITFNLTGYNEQTYLVQLAPGETTSLSAVLET